jgi:hypothetical protein
MPLINWHWLEDLLVRACELEVRVFAADHPDESFFAFCLEFDGLDGAMQLSYGTRAAVDGAFRRRIAKGREDAPDYRTVELQPEFWSRRTAAVVDPEGYWSRARPQLEMYRELMAEDRDPDEAEFYWVRLEYLTECVLRRLIERDGFRPLRRDPEFLAYSFCPTERMEELEARIEKLYPNYRRATQEWIEQPRPGYFQGITCDGPTCSDPPAEENLTRCTYCHGWFCERCKSEHRHPRLAERQSFFEGA